MLLHSILWSILILSTNNGFIKAFTNTYNRDWRRPTDTLVYVVDIKDYVSMSKTSRKWLKISVNEKKRQLFELLEKRTLKIEYIFAIDLVTGDVYEDPRGDLDFFQRKKRKRQLHKQDMSLWNSSVSKKMHSLINYLQLNNTDYIFQISGIFETNNKDLYWIIRDQDIYAIVISASGNEITEYPAEYYINRVAENSVFERNF